MENSEKVFISYHMDSAMDIAEEIHDRLAEAGISCWYAKKDYIGSYRDIIVDKIRACKVFLLICNKGSSRSDDVANETAICNDQRKKGHAIACVPYVVEECQFSNAIYYDFVRYNRINGMNMPKEEAYRQLVGIIKGALEETDDTGKEPVQIRAEQRYRLTNTNISVDPLFVGRNTEIEQAVSALQQCGHVALVGIGGIGKSELAKKIMEQCKDVYTEMVWVTFKGSLREVLASDNDFPIEGLSRDDYPSDDDQRYYQRKLRALKEIADQNTLIVIDNFDVAEDACLEEFCRGRYRVLVTSRYSQQVNGLKEIKIEPLDTKTELFSLFQGVHVRPIGEAERACVMELIQVLGGHTYTVRLVANIMRRQRISAANMYAILSRKAQPEGRAVSAVDSLTENLDQLFRMSKLTDEEKEIMNVLALTPLSGISVEKLCDWSGILDPSVIDDLADRNLVDLEVLTDIVHLHPLIIELICKRYLTVSAPVERFAKAVAQKVEQSYEEPVAVKEELCGYLACICDRLPKEAPVLTEVMLSHASMLKQLTRFSQSISIFEEALKREMNVELKIRGYTLLAHAFTCAEKKDECWACIEEGMRLVAALSDEQKTPQMNQTINWLLQRRSDCARRQQRVEAAEQYGKEAVEMIEAVASGKMPVEHAWSRYHYAYALLLRGKLEESERCLRQAIALLDERVQRYVVAHCRSILGQVLMCKGDYEQALAETLACRDVLVSQKEERDKNIGFCAMCLGNIYRKSGKEAAAREQYIESAEAYGKYSVELQRRALDLIDSSEIRLYMNV